MLDTLGRALVSMVVPPLCGVCREPELSGAPLCRPCRAALVPLPDPRCGRCGAPGVRLTGACGDCRGRRLAFERAWSAYVYEGVARDLVAGFKSRGRTPLARFMAAEISRLAPEGILQGALVPVPAHPERRRRHGFNHAAEIAAALARATGMPRRDLLLRPHGMPTQVGLERRSRLRGARGSVSVRPQRETPSVAVLVDDVLTTGATLDACATALRRAGAKRIFAVTFARAIRG